ncbi:alpha/beta fold hydrolase [Oscillatoria sp. FACHB-1407]|uniref:alpha/beta fold hydrolase n=1 Tax=Oscillatoria sp. FACHB-1407 TaxID=2692847 RepID=UPI00168288D5|nr:alpha/beta fold hydrolase [Oscillatoria sp. FACHB-1407]MBD2465000.1 alpha/beta fold hydrolase [Oscillatoria sp. FACHB-1407]
MVLSDSLQSTSAIWQWHDLPIRYQTAGTTGDAVILVHGFGASSDHWRKNIPVLAETHRVYALDLLGFGLSAKPTPGEPFLYTFETWGQQIVEFCQEIVGTPAFLVGNSVGCIAALQAAVMAPQLASGVVLLNCSLRLLHDRKRASLPWHRRSSAPLLQSLLSYRPFGNYFFNQLAKAKVIRKILLQAYRDPSAVTDELVDLLLQPALEPGAAAVFLAFTRYSQGPLAEDLLPQLTCPALIAWGDADPWEPIALGRELSNFPAVEDFIPLEGVGHCPQDEAPDQVNTILQNWFDKHRSSKANP